MALQTTEKPDCKICAYKGPNTDQCSVHPYATSYLTPFPELSSFYEGPCREYTPIPLSDFSITLILRDNNTKRKVDDNTFSILYSKVTKKEAVKRFEYFRKAVEVVDEKFEEIGS